MSHSLVENQIGREVQHLSIGMFVGPPAEGKGGEAHPGVLDECDLILDRQTPEACKSTGGTH